MYFIDSWSLSRIALATLVFPDPSAPTMATDTVRLDLDVLYDPFILIL